MLRKEPARFDKVKQNTKYEYYPVLPSAKTARNRETLNSSDKRHGRKKFTRIHHFFRLHNSRLYKFARSPQQKNILIRPLKYSTTRTALRVILHDVQETEGTKPYLAQYFCKLKEKKLENPKIFRGGQSSIEEIVWWMNL